MATYNAHDLEVIISQWNGRVKQMREDIYNAGVEICEEAALPEAEREARRNARFGKIIESSFGTIPDEPVIIGG